MGNGMLAASDAERLVAIDAQIQPNGQMGGVEHYLAALVRALGQLEGPERYLLVCLPEYSDWLAPYAGPNQRIVVGPTRISRRVKGIFGAAWPGVWKIGQRLWLWAARVSDAQRVPPGWVWESRGFFESLGATLLHVLYQKYVRTDLPVVFSPHDLQHEHFPVPDTRVTM
jgi:hypothetical protein